MDKLHWYCFSYYGRFIGVGEGYGSVYAGFEDKDNITKGDIDSQKRGAGMINSATLLSCSYLGFMTKRDFQRTSTTRGEML